MDNNRRRWVEWTLAIVLVFALLAFAVTALYWRHVEQGNCMSCRNNLRFVGSALRNYFLQHGAFPPAYLEDSTGKPVSSWRAEVVPSAWYNFRPGRDDYSGGPGYDNTQAWNSLRNAPMQLNQHRFGEFECLPTAEQRLALTNYVAVVGPDTMWPGSQPFKPAADGSDDDKILLIEVINSDILWVEPRDLTLEQALNTLRPKQGMGIGSRHSDGIHYVTVGGEVRTLPADIDRESLRKLLVRDTPETSPAK